MKQSKLPYFSFFIILFVLTNNLESYGQDKKLNMGVTINPELYLYTQSIKGVFYYPNERGDHNFKIIINYGIISSYHFSPRLSIKSGLIVSDKGFNKDFGKQYIQVIDPNNFPPYKTHLRSIYIDIPVTIKYTLLKHPKSSLSVFGGTSTGLLVYSKEKSTYISGDRKASERFSPSKRLITGGLVGLEYSFTIAKNIDLLFETSYKRYLGNIFKNDPDAYIQFTANGFIGTSLGVVYSIK